MPAAGVMFLSDDRVLLLRRVDTGEWAFPGGHVEPGETFEQAARRECQEEIGRECGELVEWTRRAKDGIDFVTFATRVKEQFEPVLNYEHDASDWVRVGDVAGISMQALGFALPDDIRIDAEFKEPDRTDAILDAALENLAA
jgi:8-oxo-dGTP pyrophosphatase MutT (NUDIX family)